MNRIYKILEYNFTHEVRKSFYGLWICNWIGVKWLNLEDLIDRFLSYATNFDEKKRTKLIQDLILLSEEHDFEWYFKLWFTKSNIKLAIKTYKLLYKFKFRYKFWFALFAFIAVQKVWKVYYYQNK